MGHTIQKLAKNLQKTGLTKKQTNKKTHSHLLYSNNILLQLTCFDDENKETLSVENHSKDSIVPSLVYKSAFHFLLLYAHLEIFISTAGIETGLTKGPGKGRHFQTEQVRSLGFASTVHIFFVGETEDSSSAFQSVFLLIL